MLLAEGGFTVGESVSVPVFDPVTMRTASSEIRVAVLSLLKTSVAAVNCGESTSGY